MQKEYNPAVCCFCGSGAYRQVVSGPLAPIIACTGCGLMRRGVLPEHIVRNYSYTSYAGGYERCIRQKEEKEISQIVDYLEAVKQLEKFLPKKGHLLEIGCAMGTTLNEYRRRGWDVCGVEPEQWACDCARERYGLNVVNATFQEAGFEKSSFEAVLMFHVIEHLTNPAEAFCQIAQLIKPRGYLVLETPRFDSLMFKILRGRERSVIPGHLYYFTPKTIAALSRSAGFEIARLDFVGRTVTIDRLCFYAAKFLNLPWATRLITGLSERLHLNKVRVHINLYDMMRLYLRKA
jgi:SAM-dependent methyltransferase